MGSQESWKPVLAVALLLMALGCGSAAQNGDASTESAGVDAAEIERLRALGYVGVGDPLPDGAEVGVLYHKRDRAQAGLNLLTSCAE